MKPGHVLTTHCMTSCQSEPHVCSYWNPTKYLLLSMQHCVQLSSYSSKKNLYSCDLFLKIYVAEEQMSFGSESHREEERSHKVLSV